MAWNAAYRTKVSSKTPDHSVLLGPTSSSKARGTGIRRVPGGTSNPLQMGNPARGPFSIHGKTSQLTTAATLPR